MLEKDPTLPYQTTKWLDAERRKQNKKVWIMKPKETKLSPDLKIACFIYENNLNEDLVWFDKIDKEFPMLSYPNQSLERLLDLGIISTEWDRTEKNTWLLTYYIEDISKDFIKEMYKIYEEERDNIRTEIKTFAQEQEKAMSKHESLKNMTLTELELLLSDDITTYHRNRSPELLIDITNCCMMIWHRKKTIEQKLMEMMK